MASNTDSGGESHNHFHLSSPSSSVKLAGSPYQQTYLSSQQDSGQEDKLLPAIAIAFVAFIVFIYLLCSRFLPTDTEEQEVAGGGVDDTTVRQPQRSEAGGGWVNTAMRHLSSRVAGAAAVEMAPRPVQTADEPPLVCTYSKADGWREGSCGVCLAELDDGEAVRVLPACMHYFHAACVGEWLRVHATCPLCRAPLVAPTSAAGDDDEAASGASTDAQVGEDHRRAPLPDGRQEPVPRTLNTRYYGTAWHNVC